MKNNREGSDIIERQTSEEFRLSHTDSSNHNQAANGQGNPEQEINELDKILLALQGSSINGGAPIDTAE